MYRYYSLLAVLAAACLASCHSTPSPPTKAIAVIHPLNKGRVRGLVTFTQEANGIRVVADITGLSPGKHGFHIHEYGDCSAKDGSSAGGHFNPQSKEHGAPDSLNRHVGDLGNIETGRRGKAHYERVDSLIALSGETSIIGRTVVIHELPDDFTTQPTGNAGDRIACGVIGIAKGE